MAHHGGKGTQYDGQIQMGGQVMSHKIRDVLVLSYKIRDAPVGGSGSHQWDTDPNVIPNPGQQNQSKCYIHCYGYKTIHTADHSKHRNVT